MSYSYTKHIYAFNRDIYLYSTRVLSIVTFMFFDIEEFVECFIFLFCCQEKSTNFKRKKRKQSEDKEAGSKSAEKRQKDVSNNIMNVWHTVMAYSHNVRQWRGK